MRFVYPQSPLTPRHVDEMFLEESQAFSKAGFSISLIDGDRLMDSQAKVQPPVASEEKTVYRGWMLTAAEYTNLLLSLKATDGLPLTNAEQYLATHHLPNWQKIIAEFTPETVVLAFDSDWAGELKKLGWSKFFIKDYVKSLKTSIGSVIERPEDIELVAAEMQKYRGTIEGGLCVRQVEDFLPETEQRFFVINGKPFAADSLTEIPAMVFECVRRIDSNFFSVDVILRADGQLRIVEIGDGQVSDLVGWSVNRFVDIWKNAS